MPNWFQKISQPIPVDPNLMGLEEDLEEESAPPKKEIRYRATFPLDVWIEDTGNEEQNINEAYEMITDGLSSGGLPNHLLQSSDIVRYDRLLQ